MIEQPRADTVTDLAPTTLLIRRTRVIYSQVIKISLAALIDKRQGNRAVDSPELSAARWVDRRTFPCSPLLV